MQHPGEDDLALVALGEMLPDVSSHVGGCTDCSRELRALSATVRTARHADVTPLPPPPPAVWQRISDELGLAEPDPRVPDQPRTDRPATPWRRPLLVGGAALLAAAVAAAVFAGVRGAATSGTGAPSDVSAPLLALGQGDARGRVVLSADTDRRSLLVDTSGLPRADGFYEVWLLDLEQDRLVPLGALDPSGRGRLTVPEGVRIDDYPEVDVSLEPDDGDPGHSGDSVLRGRLPA